MGDLVSVINEPCSVLCEWVNAVCERAGVRLPASPQLRERCHNFLRSGRSKYAKELRIRERQLRRHAAQKQQMIEDGWSFRERSPPGRPKSPTSPKSPKSPGVEPGKFLSAATLKRMAAKEAKKPSSPSDKTHRDFVAGADIGVIGLVAVCSKNSNGSRGAGE